MADHAKFAFAHVFHIFLPQGTGRRIPRVGEGFSAFHDALRVDLWEIIDGNIDFPAHFQRRRNRVFITAVKHVRNVADHPRICSDIFTHAAVATRRRLHEFTVTIGEVDGQPIDFQLREVAFRRRTFQPFPQLIQVEHIIQAAHGFQVLNVGKA